MTPPTRKTRKYLAPVFGEFCIRQSPSVWESVFGVVVIHSFHIVIDGISHLPEITVEPIFIIIKTKRMDDCGMVTMNGIANDLQADAELPAMLDVYHPKQVVLVIAPLG